MEGGENEFHSRRHGRRYLILLSMPATSAALHIFCTQCNQYQDGNWCNLKMKPRTHFNLFAFLKHSLQMLLLIEKFRLHSTSMPFHLMFGTKALETNWTVLGTWESMEMWMNR